MTHGKLVSPNDTHVGNSITIFIQLSHGSNNIIQMFLGQTAAVNRETNHICQFSLLLRRLQIVLHGEITQFSHTDAISADQLQRESRACECFMVPLTVEELSHIDIYGMPAGRQYNSLDTSLIKALSQVLTLHCPIVLVVEIAGLVQTGSHSHYITTAHAAIGVVAITGYLFYLDEYANVGFDSAILVEIGKLLPKHALISESQHASHIGVSVLFSGHGESVAVREHLGCDLGNGFVAVAFLIRLDIVGVLRPTSHIKHQRDIILASNAVNLPNICHGNRLAADRVICDTCEDKRHILHANSIDQLL